MFAHEGPHYSSPKLVKKCVCGVRRDVDLLLMVQAHQLLRYNNWGKSPNKHQ